MKAIDPFEERLQPAEQSPEAVLTPEAAKSKYFRQKSKKTKREKKNRKHYLLGKTSVKKKILIAFIGFTLLAMALLWLLQVVFLEQIYRNIKIKHLEEGAKEIIRVSDNAESFYQTVSAVAERYEFCAVLMNADKGSYQRLTPSPLLGSNLYDMGYNEYNQLAKLAANAGGSTMMSVISDRQGYLLYDFASAPNDQSHSVIYTVLFENADGETMALLIGTVITPISAARETLFYILLIVSGILILLSLCMAAFMARSVASPIVEINKGAKVLATGSYDHHFDESCGYREVNELAATLNYATTELAKVENLRRELIANISHDLRTPLTLISGYSEVMRDIPGEITPENLQTIIDETARLTSLVNDMLEISKIQSGTLIPEMAPLSVNELLRSVMDTYRTLTACKGYQLLLLPDPDSAEAAEQVYVMGDRAMLVRAVNNLINNALTYTGDDHVVAVRQINTPTRVRIEVSDTGAGIPREKMDLIWERYYKVDAEHKRSAVGTGLGLSIVKSIVAMHGGAYGVRSSEGSGSTFWIEFDRME